MAYHPEWIRAYYRSNTWRLRRSRYYKRHPYQCASCGTKTKVALHHVTYAGEWGDLRNQADWGKEPDQALMPLCMRRWFRQGCHNNVHAARGQAGSGTCKRPLSTSWPVAGAGELDKASSASSRQS